MKKISLAVNCAFAIAALVCAPAFAQQMPGGPQQADMQLDKAQRQQLIDSAIRELHASYVFPDKAKQIEQAIRGHQKRGAYDGISSAKKLSETLTAHMVDVTKDKHLHMFYSAQPVPELAPSKKSADQLAAELAEMKSMNFGVERIERLPFNIGYLDLRGFAPARDAAATLAAAMTALSHTNAIIIDLRKNGGGEPETVALLVSYFLDKRTHLTDIYFRHGDRTEQMWSGDAVAGAHIGSKKDVYILTSKHTFSAAEDFSYVMKNLKRATIVGETTGGGAHPGDVVALNKNFAMFIPNGRSISPLTKTNWEGVGVAPDISAKADDAMNVAQAAILKKMAGAEHNPGRMARINDRIAKLQGETAAKSAP